MKKKIKNGIVVLLLMAVSFWLGKDYGEFKATHEHCRLVSGVNFELAHIICEHSPTSSKKVDVDKQNKRAQ